MDSEVKRLQELIQELEECAAKKDQQISQLTSRMRKYEMGEYGLAEAVSEIKECRKLIRARDWEIERLTDEVNNLKLQISALRDKSKESEEKVVEISESLSKEADFIDTKRDCTEQGKKKVDSLSKRSQCYLPIQPSKYIEEICSSQVQNEQLRVQLSKVCEEALKTSINLQKFNREERSKQEEIIMELKENIHQLHATAKNGENFVINSYSKGEISEDFIGASLKRISKEDEEIQEMFHELVNQIKILKSNQTTLIRRYIILSDREESFRKENVKLRKAINFYWRKHSHDCNAVKLEFIKRISSKYLSHVDVTFLKEMKEQPQSACSSSLCHARTLKLTELVTKVLEEISVVQQLLEIAHHQTQAAEAVCFTQEVELKALRDQFSLFQAQSDEKMLLGKLAMKVLHLQFNQAACVYELKKYKTDKQSLQDWYNTVKKEYEENGKKFAGMYLDAQDKVKHLREVLKDLCQRCNTALSSYLTPDLK